MREHEWPSLTLAVAAAEEGIGKTLVATGLALVLQMVYPGRVQLLDCDVADPAAGLLLHPVLGAEQPVTVLTPSVDRARCTRCGRCAGVCPGRALVVTAERLLTSPERCSGCGACRHACPLGALGEVPRRLGSTVSGTTAEGLQFHGGRLHPGEAEPAALAAALRQLVRDDLLTVLEAPPGTGAVMRETVADSDYALLVATDSPGGRRGLAGAVEICRTAEVPCGVIIEGFGPGRGWLEEYCLGEGLAVLGTFPEDREVARAYARGEPALGTTPRYQRLLLEAAAVIMRETPSRGAGAGRLAGPANRDS